jgi:hypothetical protein
MVLQMRATAPLPLVVRPVRFSDKPRRDAGLRSFPDGWHTFCFPQIESDRRSSHIGPHRLASDGWAWRLPHSQSLPQVGDTQALVYIWRTFTWLFTGVMLLVGVLWLCGWAVWHAKHKQATVAYRADGKIPPYA